MKKAFIILCILVIAGAGVFYYYYDQDEKAQEAKRSLRSFMHQARNLTNELIRHKQKEDDSKIAEWEKTHSDKAIIAAVEKLIEEEWTSGRNHVGGKNWTDKMNILRDMCDNVKSFSDEAKEEFNSMSFNGMMGKDCRFSVDTIMAPYYVSDSAWVDVHFKVTDKEGTPYPNRQRVTLKLQFNPTDERWLINDFVFYYNEDHGQYQYSEMKEMQGFLEQFSSSNDSDNKDATKEDE